MQRRLVVVGAGVSGLAAAYAAAEETAQSRRTGGGEAVLELAVTVLEGRDQVGGRARSLRQGGWLVEGGPGGYLDTDPSVARLVDKLGLGSERLAARPAAARRYIYHAGRLHEVGPNLIRLLRTGLLGPGNLLRMLGEPFVRRREDDSEESILEFCRRRFGPVIAERLVHTAMLGIFAGDAARLSLDACFPELRALERDHGSVIRGALVRRRRLRSSVPAQDGVAPSRKLSSFRAGLQQLPLALAKDPRVQVRTGVVVTELEQLEGGYRLSTREHGCIDADAVVVAAPVQVAARLLAGIAPHAGERLAGVPVPPVAVVGLGFDATVVAGIPRGFGVLVARNEGVRMLGCLWESHIYPGRSPEGKFLVRAMYGGRLDPQAMELDDAELLRQAHRELGTVLGIEAPPEYHRIVRWPHAIPQYEVGHLAIRGAVEHDLEALPGLFLAGDSLEGVSYTKTAAAGLRQGAAAARYLLGRAE